MLFLSLFGVVFIHSLASKHWPNREFIGHKKNPHTTWWQSPRCKPSEIGVCRMFSSSTSKSLCRFRYSSGGEKTKHKSCFLGESESWISCFKFQGHVWMCTTKIGWGKVRGKKTMMLQKDGVCGLSFMSASERKIIPVCFCWYKHLGFCLWGSGGWPTIRNHETAWNCDSLHG